ncbi:MAG: CYTH domain-containing protein [Phycisphaerales bacterium]|nr:CYTH domain-containing protein [Phycisphaerales bacterium]
MNDAMQEIERKFLVPVLPPDLAPTRRRDIDQGYVAVDGATEVRVRRTDDRYLIAVKSGGGMVRTEVEFEIDRARFAALWELCTGRRLAKHRLDIPHGSHLIEVDVYEGPLAGLIVAEVEFASAQEAEAFTPPSWFGRDITDDLAFKNSALSKLKAPPPG